MHKFVIAFLALAAIEMGQGLTSDSHSKQTKLFNINPKGIDYKIQGKKDEHRYGVELKENKQFHHTKTEEDGVRLGCYGHTADDGKKFSTHYVADAKGYRLVSPKGLINVFPKDGGEPRNASFSESFTEDEVRSSNIRYFFPAGCHSGRFDEIPIPPIQKKDDAIKIPETTTEVITEPPTTITEEIVTEEPIAIMPAIERCENECCDDKFARIILSKSKTGISKIVIPIETDLLSRCSIEEIVDITSETDNVKLLTMLLKFVKRYKL